MKLKFTKPQNKVVLRIYKIVSLVKYLSIFFIVPFTLVDGCSTYHSEQNDIIEKQKLLVNAQKGLLKITTRIGRTSRSVTISAIGYIEGIDSSTVERRVVIGIGNEYSKSLEKFEGESLPIWYNIKNGFILARVYESKKVTIDKMIAENDERKGSFWKGTIIAFSFIFFLYGLGKIINKIFNFEYE